MLTERASSADSRNDVGEGEPLPPSRFARDIDPRIEDVILACLERDVAARPRSAIAVATALPGGEPLAAALNAGRIPSPEMVAAARQNALRPAVAWTLAGCLVAGVGAISFLTRDELRKVAPRRSPPVLVARAQEVIRSLGYNRAPADSAYWFTWKRSYREQATDRDVTFRTNEAEPPGGARLLRFVYRESPDPLLAGNLFGRVTYRDPPAEVPGMVDVNLDTEGRLLRFVAVPGMREQPVELPPSKPSWSALLERAELQANELVAVAPRCTPPVAHDTWMEWETRPVEPIERLRVTAAAFDGRPVYFDMDTVREDPPAAHSGDATPTVSRLTSEPTVLFAIAAVALVSAILVARYRLLLGQDDRRGASRLALYFFSLNLISTVLWPDHVAHFSEEYFLIAKVVAWGLYWSATGAVLYLAFEPSVRRRWPAMLIGWNRVLAGRIDDPIVGRDLLVGTVAGTAMAGLLWLAHASGSVFGLVAVPPFRPALEAFREPRHLAALVIYLHASALVTGLGSLFLFLSLRSLLRAKSLAMVAWIVGYGVVVVRTATLGSDWRVGLPGCLAAAVLAFLVLDRFGLVALCATAFTSSVFTSLPAALEFSAWYSNRSLISLGIIVGIGLYGARTAVRSLARRI